MVLQDLEQARWFLEEIQPHEVALRKYLRAHFPQIRDIDDVVQETFNRLLLAHRSIQIDKPRAYLFRIARNVAVDLYRRHEIISAENLGDFESCDVVEDSGPNPAQCAINDDDLRILNDAIAELPERCRMVLQICRYQGLSYLEAGQKLGISEKTVSAQLSIAMSRCRRYLRAHGVLTNNQKVAHDGL